MQDSSIVKFKTPLRKVIAPTQHINSEIFILRETPNSIKELILSAGYSKEISNKFILIHNKKGITDKLLNEIKITMGASYNFIHLDLHKITLTNLKKKISSLKELKNTILIIRNTSHNKSIHNLCTYIYSLRRLCGIWLCDHLSNYSPTIVPFFDDLFLFDLTYKEYEMLCSSISLKNKIVEKLCIGSQSRLNQNQVVFISNSANKYFFQQNTLVLNIEGEDYKMDIIPFVPVLVEASKFLFTEASKFIDDFKKNSETNNELAISLPIPKEIILNTNNDYNEITKNLSDKITQNQVDSVNMLVEKIQMGASIVRELEKQEMVASGEELAKVSYLIKQKSRAVMENIEKLNSTLNAVYIKNIP